MKKLLIATAILALTAPAVAGKKVEDKTEKSKVIKRQFFLEWRLMVVFMY